MLKKGYYTAVLPNESHLTFHIAEIKEGGLKGKIKIGFLNGTNNENSYKYFGFVNGNFVDVWKNFRETTPSPQIEKLRTGVTILKNDPDQAGRAYALESGLCYRCNKLLTNPDSIQNGIGPHCSRK